MRKSIKVKISIMILVCIFIMVAVIIFANTMLLEKYYLKDKQKTFERTYETADEYLTKLLAMEISGEEFSGKMEEIMSASNISIMILNDDWSYVYASMRDVEGAVQRLQNYLFTKILHGDEFDERIKGLKTVTKHKNYSIYEIYNPNMKDTYMELIGNTTSGKIIYMTLAVRSIEENVAISNRFIIYVGLLVAVIGAVGAFVLGNVMARPIKELSQVAEKMSELDFDARCSYEEEDEIGVLGKCMNKLSERLEETISELKGANVELLKDIKTKEEIDEMRKEFLSNVSHELKTPIALIQGYAEGLKEGVIDDPESMEFYCDVIVDEAGKMNSMVQKLLTLNQIEFGKEQLEIERFDVVEVIKGVMAANRLPAENKGIKMELAGENSVNVWADEYKICEVFTNYITNAINHCYENGRIVVSIKDMDNLARISVFNTGDVIPEAELENVWIKFYKVDKARTRAYGGSGIGLSIVKAIMEQHRQQCGVINHKDGVEFWFELDTKNV